MRKLDSQAKQELLAPFQAAEVRIRTGNPPLPYVTARVVMSRLDDVFPFQWSFTLGECWTDDKGTLNQKCRLTLILSDTPTPIGLPELRFEDVGSAQPDVGNAPRKQAKQAVSDGFKRCAVHLGVSRYLYELSGVRADGIPEASLKKALAAVGYAGGIEKHHWGKIGGIRELDTEDEEPGVIPATAPEPQPAKSKYSPAQLALAQDIKEHFGGDKAEAALFLKAATTKPLEALTDDDITDIRERLKAEAPY